MEIAFDPAKHAINVAKHGISLARAGELQVLTFIDDSARFNEARYRLYGLSDGRPHCLAVVDRDESFARSACDARVRRSCAVMGYEKPVVFDDDNPEWAEADFARARPIGEFPEHLRAAFPHTDFPQVVAVEQERFVDLDPDVLAKFRATGPGWQVRVNEAFRAAPL